MQANKAIVFSSNQDELVNIKRVNLKITFSILTWKLKTRTPQGPPIKNLELNQPQQSKLSLSSPDFINFSVRSPIQMFHDTINNISWDFRQGGNTSLDEAVILIPGIAETTNSMFLIATSLIELGYRVIIISIPAYDTILHFLSGFDFFTAKLRVSRIHIIGVGFGGFLGLHIASFNQLSATISSLIIISSFLSTDLFRKNNNIFTKITGKSQLYDELCQNLVPKHLKESNAFLETEITHLPNAMVCARLKLRSNTNRAPIPELENGCVLVIQSLDFAYKLKDDAIPSKCIKNAKVALIKRGGNCPHLAAPNELLIYMKLHLQKWHTPLEKLKCNEEFDEVDEES